MKSFRLLLLIFSWSIFLSQISIAGTDVSGEVTSIPVPSGNTTINAAITDLLSPDSQKQANALRVLINTSDARAAIPILDYMSKPIEVEGSESATVHFQLKKMAIEAFKANSGLQFPAADPRNRLMWDAAIKNLRNDLSNNQSPRIIPPNSNSYVGSMKSDNVPSGATNKPAAQYSREANHITNQNPNSEAPFKTSAVIIFLAVAVLCVLGVAALYLVKRRRITKR